MAEITEHPSLGPVQLMVIGFDSEAEFDGAALREFSRLDEAGTVRLLDAVVVRKEDDGSIEAVQASTLGVEEAERMGVIAGALIGLGAGGEEGAEIGALEGAEAGSDGHLLSDSDVWFVADSIPVGSAVGVILIEHLWAIPLRDAMRDKRGVVLAESWVHPLDLVAIGALASRPGPLI